MSWQAGCFCLGQRISSDWANDMEAENKRTKTINERNMASPTMQKSKLQWKISTICGSNQDFHSRWRLAYGKRRRFEGMLGS
jgi:hypothetical protein